VTARKTLSRLLPLSLTFGLLLTACDGGAEAGKKADAKAADAKKTGDEANAKAPEVKADEKPEADTPEVAEKPAEAADAKPEDNAGEGEPKAEEPKAEEPKAEEPKAEEPKADESKTDKPKADKPKADKPKADKPKADDPEPAAGDASSGKEIYRKKCKNCHGVSGAADTKIAAKHDIASWKVPGWKSKWSMSKVKDIVANGKSGTKMKAFKGKLTPAEIDAVSAYSRSLGK